MKLKIMIMALLLATAGIGSATHYQSATTFRGDINTGGNDITGSEYLDEEDIDWSTMPVMNFAGTTGAELESFITAAGDGVTILIQNDLIIDSAIDISNNLVRLVGMGSRGSTALNVTGSSGYGINVTGYGCVIENLYIYQSIAGLDYLIRFDRAHHDIKIKDVKLHVTDGGGVLLEKSFKPEITNCLFQGPETNAGTGVVVGSSSGAASSPFVCNTWFVNLEKAIELVNTSGPRISTIYTYANLSGGDSYGIYISPCEDDAVIDAEIFGNSILDYANGNGHAIYSIDTYRTLRLYCYDCYAWAQDSDAIYLQNTERVTLSNVRAGSNSGIGVNIVATCTGPVMVDACQFYARTIGISLNGVNDITLVGNYAKVSGGTVGIYVNNCSHSTIVGNRLDDCNLKLMGGLTDYIVAIANVWAELENYTGASHIENAHNLEDGPT